MNLEKSLDLLIGKLDGWLRDFVLLLPNLILALAVVVLFGVAARIVRKILEPILRRISERGPLNRLVINLVSLGVLSVGALTALSILHLDKTVMSLLAGVGVIGLALGFAFQDIAANFMAGLLILMRRPLRIGDIVETNDFFGRVTGIDLRNTIIRTWSGKDVLVPNKEVFQNPLTNYSRTSDRRVELVVGVSYGEDLPRVEQVTRDALEQLPHRDAERPLEIFFTEFGDSSINFELFFWIDTAEQGAFYEARSAAIVKIKAAYDANGLTIPFPIRTLDFGIKGGEKLADIWPAARASRVIE
jgi:small conductance mechanosensitive channel